MDAYALLIAATLNAGTVLALAALGLLINEKAGVVNLGAEGMMLCAAIAGFATVVHTGSDTMGFVAGMLAGGVMAATFGGLVIWLNTNQYATGLALSLFGTGFSAFEPTGSVASVALAQASNQPAGISAAFWLSGTPVSQRSRADAIETLRYAPSGAPLSVSEAPPARIHWGA